MRSALLRLTCFAVVIAAIVALAPAAHSGPAHDTSRIVSIGGAVTEILYALGLEQNIVAVDSTSHYPPQALREKPSVGYFRQLSPEGVLGLNPSLILAIEGAGPKQAVSVLQSAGVAFVSVPDNFTGEGIIEKIRVIAAAAGVEKRGECLVDAVAADLDVLARLRSGIGKPARALFVLSFVGDRAQVAGRVTAAEGIMRLCGATNAITEFEGYKAVSDEAIIAAQPEAVAGVIGFVGIVVPHLLRLMIGPGHRLLLPASVVLGAILMVGADTGARMLAAPAEVPIGILTAAIGAPFFLAILLRQRSVASL